MISKLINNIKLSYRTWQFGREKTELRDLPDGSIVIRTVKTRTYFYSHHGQGLPVMISKEEGDRLWYYESAR